MIEVIMLYVLEALYLLENKSVQVNVALKYAFVFIAIGEIYLQVFFDSSFLFYD